LPLSNCRGILIIIHPMFCATIKQHPMDQHIFRSQHHHVRTKQLHAPQPFNHWLIQREGVRSLGITKRQVIEDVDPTPHDSFSIKLTDPLCFLHQLHDDFEGVGRNQNINVFKRTAIAVEMRSCPPTYSPHNSIFIEQPLNDAKITSNERHRITSSFFSQQSFAHDNGQDNPYILTILPALLNSTMFSLSLIVIVQTPHLSSSHGEVLHHRIRVGCRRTALIPLAPFSPWEKGILKPLSRWERGLG